MVPGRGRPAWRQLGGISSSGLTLVHRRAAGSREGGWEALGDLVLPVHLPQDGVSAAMPFPMGLCLIFFKFPSDDFTPPGVIHTNNIL